MVRERVQRSDKVLSRIRRQVIKRLLRCKNFEGMSEDISIRKNSRDKEQFFSASIGNQAGVQDGKTTIVKDDEINKMLVKEASSIAVS